jgi:hypothetical protein
VPAGEHDAPVEIAIECHRATPLRRDSIARDRSSALENASARVRTHRSAPGDEHLFRLLSVPG